MITWSDYIFLQVMMTLEHEILLNQFGQGVIDATPLLQVFTALDTAEQSDCFQWLLFFIQQSRPYETDVDAAIAGSGLKPTFTPCVMLKRFGVKIGTLQQIARLPIREYDRVWTLFLSIYKIAYIRRFEKEKNNPLKWWYWDLSDEGNLTKIRGGINNL